MFTSHFRKNLIVQEISQDENEFDNNPEIQAVLDVINKGKKANLFSEVAQNIIETIKTFFFLLLCYRIRNS